MAGYRRFISYMYAYNEGKKNKNTGFVKVESRNGVCRIQVHLQELPQEEETLDIYAFVRKDRQLLGLFLGQIAVQSQAADARITTPSEQIAEQPYSLDNVAGIWVQSSFGRKYITVFDDDPIDMRRFTTELPQTQAVVKEVVQEIVSEAAEVPEGIPAETEMMASEPEAAVMADVPEETVEMEAAAPEDMPVAASETEITADEPELQAAEAAVAESAAEAAVPTTTNDAEASEGIQSQEAARCLPPQDNCPQRRQCNQQGMNERWNCMARQHPHFRPFEDEEVEDCIQILPRDLRMLNQNHWRMGNNSFVMHGYYNYRHLLLGRKRSGGYILGVPGVFESQEQMSAEMFGFPVFKEAANPGRNGKFGYWCREVD